MAGESLHTSEQAHAAGQAAEPAFQAPQAASQAKFLRAIGQDLEARGIASFSLSFGDDHYRVRAARVAQRISAPAPRWFWPRRNLQQTAETAPAEIHYSYEDIERLDRLGREKRASHSLPDFLSVSQQLRAVGAIVDRKRGQLLRLERLAGEGRIASLTIQLQTAKGKCVAEQHSSSTLYDFCVRMYKSRKDHTAAPAPSQAL